MPGAFVLAQALLVLLAIVSFVPAILAAAKGRYGLASALAVVGLFFGVAPWLLMFGLGRFLGDASAVLFFASFLFAPGASCVVLFLPRQSRAEPISDVAIAPWLRNMREDLERKRQGASSSSNQENTNS